MQSIVAVIQLIQPFTIYVFLAAFAAMVATNVLMAKGKVRLARGFSLATAILSAVVMMVECALFIVTFSVCSAVLALLWAYLTYSYPNRYAQLKGM